MTEETKNANVTEAVPLDGSAFARVLRRLMEDRDIPADVEHAIALGERLGYDPEKFRGRLAAEEGADLGDLTPLARELDLTGLEMRFLALAYALEEERELEDLAGQDSPRVARPEEIVETYEELPENQKLQPLRCRAGSSTDSPCPRDATTWMYPEDRDHPLCGEHARANELWLEASDEGIAEEVTRDWLRVARAWDFEGLEQLAVNAHESAKEELLKAEARANLAQEIADAPRESRMDRIGGLTPEQDAESRRLMNRSDGLNNARTALEDYATGKVDEKSLRRTLAVLIEEGEKANEEVNAYHEEIGIRGE